MAGVPERLVEHGHAPDAVRSVEDRDLRADLRKRLEQLPPGHPSSPYEHDGTKKPPVPNLAEHERGNPGDGANDQTQRSEDSTSKGSDGRSVQLEAPDRSSEFIDEQPMPSDPPTIGEDGSWEWKGCYLTPAQSQIADKALERFRIAEGRDETGAYHDHGITPAMRRIESELKHGRLVDRTEEFALKSTDRFKEKVADRITLKPDTPVKDLTEAIHDGIRYTFLYSDESYLDGFHETESRLEEHGYQLEVRKPCWNGDEYKGLNSQWFAPELGVLFEVQFHTPASWEAKQQTHAAYEKLADPRTSSAEREKLESFQREITALVPVPPGAPDIPYYRREEARS